MKKKNNNEEKMENFLDVFIRNYKTVPGVKILTKLFLYFVFLITFVMIIAISNYSRKTNNDVSTTTTIEVVNKNYYDIINNLSSVKKETVLIGDVKLNLDIDETINGYEEKENEIKKVIIKENKLYEINNGVETISELITDASFINPSELMKYLLNNKSIKLNEDDNITYKYNDLTVYVKGEKINKVTINSGYEINYN